VRDANCWCACDDTSYVRRLPEDPTRPLIQGTNRGARIKLSRFDHVVATRFRRSAAISTPIQGSSRDCERPPAGGPLVELHGERLPVRRNS
jgi:hypothetical protein